jgi:3-polyprenyl-4-hydroxybenzoate decarboxylase
MHPSFITADDIDATNTREAVWAFATRCHPYRGEIHFTKEATSPLVAFLESAEKMSGKRRTGTSPYSRTSRSEALNRGTCSATDEIRLSVQLIVILNS